MTRRALSATRSLRQPRSLIAAMIFGVVYLAALTLVVAPRSVLGASPAALSGHAAWLQASDDAP